MPGFVAVLDAAALVPVALADTLLRLAELGLYRPIWSARILDEVKAAVLEIHPDLNPSRIDARLNDMNRAFEGACVSGWEPLVDGLDLPDPDDRHVVAAGIRGGAELIVTPNQNDFPAPTLAGLGLATKSPDEFLLDQLDLDPVATVELLRGQARDLRRPPATVSDVIRSLDLAGAPRFAAQVHDLVLVLEADQGP